MFFTLFIFFSGMGFSQDGIGDLCTDEGPELLQFWLLELLKTAFILWSEIDLTDYSCLPNDLVSMFASFSMTSTRKGYVPVFVHEFVCFQLKLNHKIISLTPLCTKCE